MENFRISFQVLFLTIRDDGSHVLHRKEYSYRKSQNDWNLFLKMPVQLTSIRVLRQLLRTTQIGRSEIEEIMKELELHPMKFSVSVKGETCYIDDVLTTALMSEQFKGFTKTSPNENVMRFTALFVRL